MLMQVDLQTFALNLALIIGTLVLLLGAFILFIVTWTGVSALIWVIQRWRAQREFIRKTRRADGQPYPPFIEGVCGQCHRGSTTIYFPPSGDELCPACYDRFWRREESCATA